MSNQILFLAVHIASVFLSADAKHDANATHATNASHAADAAHATNATNATDATSDEDGAEEGESVCRDGIIVPIWYDTDFNLYVSGFILEFMKLT